MQALSSNEYVKSVQLGEVLFIDSSMTSIQDEIGLTRRSKHENLNLAIAKFTAHCSLDPNSKSVDVKSLITESFANFLNTTVTFNIAGIIYISEAHKQKIKNHLKISNNFKPPTVEEFDKIMTDENKDYCRNNNQWTQWHSVDDAKNGSDFEILADHVNINK